MLPDSLATRARECNATPEQIDELEKVVDEFSDALDHIYARERSIVSPYMLDGGLDAERRKLTSEYIVKCEAILGAEWVAGNET